MAGARCPPPPPPLKPRRTTFCPPPTTSNPNDARMSGQGEDSLPSCLHKNRDCSAKERKRTREGAGDAHETKRRSRLQPHRSRTLQGSRRQFLSHLKACLPAIRQENGTKEEGDRRSPAGEERPVPLPLLARLSSLSSPSGPEDDPVRIPRD